jgi:hypothetical protein
MTLFYQRFDFERAGRLAGITDFSRNADDTGYANQHTQAAYQVWESLAQSQNARTRPPAWLIRRRGRDVNICVNDPYRTYSAQQMQDQAARGFELPLALYPSVPTVSASAQACLMEHVRVRSLKGYSAELDRRYEGGDLVFAALAYADQALPAPFGMVDYWPWEGAPMKKDEPLRAIEKAVGLLISEHERLSAIQAEEAAQ